MREISWSTVVCAKFHGTRWYVRNFMGQAVDPSQTIKRQNQREDFQLISSSCIKRKIALGGLKFMNFGGDPNNSCVNCTVLQLNPKFEKV